ncbi:hypothetical protein [Tengunoibacter tsumagoiensis]|uniref:Uncharacterized protein n=1 Tax=Tengunoibacter tsumagoiensis TaxID=2014871 RepID=A0A401ZUS9_9CHLR|nr:hypothetical protein [Tengunoibacter tsumagoiensis]GCE10633.1 hypothetical protein KTT_04920 [Tengunoibacter tsumagoiensis]
MNTPYILAQAMQNNPPSHLRILKGKGSSLLEGLGGFLAGAAVGVALETIVILFEILPNDPYGLRPLLKLFVRGELELNTANPFYMFQYTHRLWILPLLIGFLYGLWSFWKTRQQKRSLLVIAPDGLVYCTNYQDNVRRSTVAVDFAELKSVKMLGKARLRAAQLLKDRDPHTTTRLELKYRNGKTNELKIDSRFGSSALIAEEILTAAQTAIA